MNVNNSRFSGLKSLNNHMHFRREVTHCELFESVKALVSAAQDFFDRHNLCPQRILPVIGAIPKSLPVCT